MLPLLLGARKGDEGVRERDHVQRRRRGRRRDARDKRAVIGLADARVEPRAVVVVPIDALAALAAVDDARGEQVRLAAVAEAVARRRLAAPLRAGVCPRCATPRARPQRADAPVARALSAAYWDWIFAPFSVKYELSSPVDPACTVPAL